MRVVLVKRFWWENFLWLFIKNHRNRNFSRAFFQGKLLSLVTVLLLRLVVKSLLVQAFIGRGVLNLSIVDLDRMLLAWDVNLNNGDILWLWILSLAIWALVTAVACSFVAFFDASLEVAVVRKLLKRRSVVQLLVVLIILEVVCFGLGWKRAGRMNGRTDSLEIGGRVDI